MSLRPFVRRALAGLGLEVRRTSGLPGLDPFIDMRKLAGDAPVVLFDVGANRGQTVERFRKVFTQPQIHAFEPDRATFAELQRSHQGTPGVHLNNGALGAAAEEREFIENSPSVMSSFLESGPDGWGTIRERVSASVRTVDGYCAEHRLARIDVLKSDTQGFDLEVLKGAEAMIAGHRVHMVYVELMMAELYTGRPDLHEVYGFLRRCGFQLVTFYEMSYRNGRAGWVDALFIDPSFATS